MVATTFSSDTPNWVTEQVRKFGVAGNWQWWAFVLTGVSTVFFYARLWRRIGVLTDLEFYELRYSGAAATWVRGFRAVFYKEMLHARRDRLAKRRNTDNACADGCDCKLTPAAGTTSMSMLPRQQAAVRWLAIEMPPCERISVVSSPLTSSNS